TVRKVVLQNLPFLMTDTVGFIRKLPHQLIESFKSTLDETRESDLLVHVVDVAHPNFEEHFRVVNETLKEIGVSDKPMLVVFNKVDAYRYTPKDEDDLTAESKENMSLEALQSSWMASLGETRAVFISAQQKLNIEEFRTVLYELVRQIHITRFPFNDFLFDLYE
ncbi:MAG: GTPase, partial [Flavobacteriales bacterium]